MANFEVETEYSVPSQPLTLFRENRGVELFEITDGTSNTIMVVESAEAVPWTKPADLPFGEDSVLPRLGGSMPDGFAALFADGGVRYLDRGLESRLLHCLITPGGGEVVSTDQIRYPNSLAPVGLVLSEPESPSGTGLPTDAQGYAGARTLGNAVGILKVRLNREGKSELAEWLTEQRARRAIHAGLQTYETFLRRVGEPEIPREQFEIIRPACAQMVRDGTWPADCWFSTTFGVETRNGINYDHHQVNLNLHGEDRGKSFSMKLLILDIFSGPVERRSDAEVR